MVGYVCRFPADGQNHVGYWVARAWWGRGVATRALHLLLGEVSDRPLFAAVATSNRASLRVLEKCGFAVEGCRHSPATDRYPACDEVVMVLHEPSPHDGAGPTAADPLPWTVLGTEYLHRGPWLTVRRDRVRLPAGAVLDDYHVLEYPAWVSVVAVTPDDRLVLVRQYRNGVGAVHDELPAGTVEPGDPDSLAAAKRELLEETGYGAGSGRRS